ncbi:hypothetical protein [Pelotomaculum propionicicum]|uniref:Uncharacterized protein n=1 Tax=Pelotomaculum propionicicum TaxID=258475 RepID=A0A4Y7RU89_9FIRM|nr:hypothetical protein [Pelotomaculum propionicicum]TEB12564.1 hypothetical protein Pmgp_00895 [Pelotomaculum propionicicum]
MANQLLQNNGFENDLNGYIIQGSITTNSDFACSGEKSALLLATTTDIAEMSQVVFFISPGSQVVFSFYARKYLSKNVVNASNFRVEVNFINFIGTVISPGIVIKGRGRDINENVWKRYNGFAVVPPGTIAAQVVVRLEPPADGTSGLLIDDLELLSEVMPAPPSTAAFPVQPGIPMFPNIPFTSPVSPLPQGISALPGFPFAPPSPIPVSAAQNQNPLIPVPPFVNPVLPGLPFPNLPFPGASPPNPLFPVAPSANQAFLESSFLNPVAPGTPPVNTFFSDLPFNLLPPAPASPAHQEYPAFPGSLLANLPIPLLSLLYPGSPFVNLLFQGAPFNITPEASTVIKKED